MGLQNPGQVSMGLEQLLVDYHDKEVVQLLKFGFPVSYNSEENPVPAEINHRGATMFPHHIEAYLQKEIRLDATIGPFKIPPFVNRIGISPLSTCPKKSSTERRTILDLPYLIHKSVNDGIDKNMYCNKLVNLTYPTINTFTKRIAELREKHPNKTILLYRRDLARYFRQLPLCPMDYSLIGMRWNNLLFFDKFMRMGL